MSNKTQLSNNNDKLASLIQELANKAAGGGSGAVETCSVRIINNDNGIYGYSYLAYRDGQFVPVLFNNYVAKNNLDVTLPDVICGGCVYIQTCVMINMMEIQVVGEATANTENIVGSGNAVVMVYAPNTAGSESTVTIVDLE